MPAATVGSGLICRPPAGFFWHVVGASLIRLLPRSSAVATASADRLTLRRASIPYLRLLHRSDLIVADAVRWLSWGAA